MNDAEKDEIARIAARLATLDAERAELAERLAVFQCRREAATRVDDSPVQAGNPPAITAASSTADKVTLFQPTVRRPYRYFSRPMGEPKNWPIRLRSGLRQ